MSRRLCSHILRPAFRQNLCVSGSSTYLGHRIRWRSNFSTPTGSGSNQLPQNSLAPSQASGSSLREGNEDDDEVFDEEILSGIPEVELGEDEEMYKDTEEESQYPDLMVSDPMYDAVQEFTFRNPDGHGAKVTIRNDPPLSKDPRMIWPRAGIPDEDKVDPFALISPNARKRSRYHIYPMIQRRVTQQTSKGRKHRMYFLYVVGNGDGLVGFGEGKHENVPRAKSLAMMEALRNMDYVERFEQRTIWTEIETKLSATRIQMRPRPVGFGLHCNPNIHQVLKAAGIKDVSAKVWGSRNPITVIKATCRMIQSGHAPLSMGDGLGGKGRTLEAGGGLRSREVVERERGRRMLDARTW
ncbi:hypothetical protein BD410DRAFT_788132 [Rickenella mellea]|uniref:Small ribosomal subunit protein uS5m n=1 Tax=Rickenella mellea TaxID=50990 RepID=A0A4Y7Q5F0_9AGAM|nr:hypothetical protein BD410DRAFT_788132 [Rickenella mellea]